MENSGAGVTFSEADIERCKLLTGLINKGEFKLGATQILEAAQALLWFNKELFPSMNSNIMELKKIVKPKVEIAPEVSVSDTAHSVDSSSPEAV